MCFEKKQTWCFKMFDNSVTFLRKYRISIRSGTIWRLNDDKILDHFMLVSSGFCSVFAKPVPHKNTWINSFSYFFVLKTNINSRAFENAKHASTLSYKHPYVYSHPSQNILTSTSHHPSLSHTDVAARRPGEERSASRLSRTVCRACPPLKAARGRTPRSLVRGILPRSFPLRLCHLSRITPRYGPRPSRRCPYFPKRERAAGGWG